MNGRIWHKISYVTAHLTVFVVTCVLLGAFYVQFVEGEFPCPLCILQRMAMMLAVMGPALMLMRGRRHRALNLGQFTTAFGLTILGAVLGSAVSIRQILLHIMPGQTGYGSPVFGLYLYSWALVVFVVLLLDAGIHLTFAKDVVPDEPKSPHIVSKFVTGLFGLVVAANAIAVFIEAGFHLFLPGNPDAYRLFM